ncbi:MAG: pyruvate dehydrogenase complex E1 component subunit beta [bacterium]|nr:pyruvate dehydrogenase complex E1 component subunit beta [bacterium]
MAELTVREALNQAMAEEMERDPNVFLMGEEVGFYNGAYKVSQGLLDRFGPMRVIDTPITELGFTGVGVGAAMVGLRPIIEMMTFNFSILALDQIINNAAKMRYMSGGQFDMPLTIRGVNGAAHQLAAQHSQSLEVLFTHFPGLKVIAPSIPKDFKGLLKSAIRDDNTVIFMESEVLYSYKGEVPDGEFTIPIGVGDIKREGTDCTVIAWGKAIHTALAAAKELEKEGISIEIVDPRTLRPLDENLIFESVKKTNRAVIVEEALPFSSVGSEISYRIQKNVFDYLDAPIEKVNGKDVPMPYNKHLEHLALPQVADVIQSVKRSLYLI